MLRVAMHERLLRMSAARAILPFVRFACTSPSGCCWWDDQGIRHNVTQAEGREQGHLLMLLLFSIVIQGALEEVATILLQESNCAHFSMSCSRCVHQIG